MAALNIIMKAPTGWTGSAQVLSGTTYTPDSNGFVTVVQTDVRDMEANGFIPVANLTRNNFTATTDPIVSNDNTQDYGSGSLWYNTGAGSSGPRMWECMSAATGAAVWLPKSPPMAQFRNVLDGGDFTTNPAQRNVPGLQASAGVQTAVTGTTPGYFADRWFVAGSGTTSVYQSLLADTSIAGFATSCKVQRTAANANTAILYFGQVIETGDSIRFQGQQMTLSFWAKQGANYSGGNLTVQLISGTGTNQSAASMVAATWTGQSNVINGSQPLTGSMVRYQFSGTVPAGATQLGVLFSFTPSGTAGADDSVSFNGVQLELGAVASPFEHRDVLLELEIAQRYAYVVAEPAAGVVVGSGMINGTNAELIYIPFPTQMRAAPTVTLSAGLFKFNIAGVATAVAGFASGATHTPNAMSLVGTTTATAGQATNLQGGGGTGYISASADF